MDDFHWAIAFGGRDDWDDVLWMRWKMGIECENGGYKYKAFFNGEWHDLTLSDSPNELTEWLKSNEEWARVKHGHWKSTPTGWIYCSECECEPPNEINVETPYCPWCGAKMDEVKYGT